MFTRNESNTDRLIRLVIGVVLLWIGLGPLNGFASVGGVIVTLLGVVAVVTAITGVCLLYRLFGISTYKEPS